MAVDPASAAAIIQAAPAVWELGKDIGGSIYAGVHNATEGWNPWLKHPARILTGAATGFAGFLGGQEKLKTQQQQQAADQLIDNFMKNPGSQFVNPQLLARAQRAAGGGMGRDPQTDAVARRWLTGEGGIPYDTNLANQLLRGDIPPSVATAMDRQLGTRFDRLRRDQGGQLARAGVLRSSAGGRLMADTYDSQRDALSNAYMNTLLQRQSLGLGLLNSADASRRALMGMGANQLNRQADRDLAYQQMGFNVLSDADRRKYARETFGLNARLGQLGQQQARRDATLESSGNILSNLYTNYRDDQRFDKSLAQQNEQFSQLLNLANAGQGGGGGGNRNISPIQAKAQLYATPQLGGGNILGQRDPFDLLSRKRTGAGGYGTPPSTSSNY